MSKHLLLTGKPGVGKTTLCKNLLDILYARFPNRIKGFYTEEVRTKDGSKKSTRIGFDIVSVDHKTRATLARVMPEGVQSRGPKVSKYTVDVNSFELNALPLINHSGSEMSIIVIDEIGKMELFSHRFKTQILKLFESSFVTLLCTVPINSIPFVDSLKSRADVEIVEVTRENRDDLANSLLDVFIRKIGN
jgi:nucleoside-triphosphatase